MKGIYCIKNIINNKQYIGSAVNYNRRKQEHLHKLRKGIHHSYYLQKSWNKYGENSFEISIIEEVSDIEKLIEREQWWIDNSPSEYNMCKKAGSVLGFKHTDITKKKLSDNQFKGVFGEKNPFSKKCYQYDLEGNFIKEWGCITDLEREFGYSNSIIVRCLKGKTNTAYNNQWFYNYKGIKIKSVIVRGGIRNKKLFNKMNDYLKINGYCGLRKMAVDLNESYNKIRSAYNRYRYEFNQYRKTI